MIPVPVTVLLHGITCAKFRFGFIRVDALRNQTLVSSSARRAYFALPVKYHANARSWIAVHAWSRSAWSLILSTSGLRCPSRCTYGQAAGVPGHQYGAWL